MNRLTYMALFVFVVGTFAAFWAYRSSDQIISPDANDTAMGSLFDSNSSVTLPKEVDQVIKNDFKHSQISITNETHCSEHCNDSLELLGLPDILTDEEYEKAISKAEDLAEYLKNNPDALTEFLELAKTDDSDKRSVIIAVFNLLDIEERLLLGEVLLESSSFRSRSDGVKFLSQPDIMDEEITQKFSEMLAAESEQFVRTALIKALNEPERLYGHRDVLNVLEKVSNEEVDGVVRGEALLARVQLEENPEQVFSDSVAAIRSDTSEYQLYGLRALNQIITLQNLDDLELSQENKDAARSLFDELRNSGYDEVPLVVLREANIIYDRYFEN